MSHKNLNRQCWGPGCTEATPAGELYCSERCYNADLRAIKDKKRRRRRVKIAKLVQGFFPLFNLKPRGKRGGK